MASQGLSRKRPAPGTSPTPYQSSYPPPAGSGNYGGLDPQVSNDQFLQFGYQPQIDNSHVSYNGSSISQQGHHSNDMGSTSNQLARRPASQVVTRDRGRGDSSDPQWTEQGNAQQLHSAWAGDLEDLRQKAQVAKRDALSKRKQIPPFVQKLASFLDDGKNTNLIRWSDDGNSFIVEDEDEFAKKLIPELFKHNNYASFVRQLNMYGFHKKVGLSDNSMRASEKKAKSPSEYSNPYFRRGHPDLLWLIQKPRNLGPNAKSKGLKRMEADQNEDEMDDLVEEIQPLQHSKSPARLAIGQGPNLPSEQLINVHRELQTIRQQQSQITAMIGRLKREHEQLYGQAANFQDQHSRHENSINAILTFLATVYNRSLQGHEGVQGIANLFTGAIPQEPNQSHVVDVGDFAFDQLNGTDGSVQRPFKKQPLLLKAPPVDIGRASTASPSSIGSPYEGRRTRRVSPGPRNGVNQSDNVEEVLEMPTHQQRSQTTNQSTGQPQNDILSVIHNTNARNSTPGTPAPDFTNVLNSLESSGGGSPLTNTQRADMLRLINNQGPASNSGANALTSPNPPPMPNSYDRRLAATKADLENLAKMQQDQDRSVQNLTNLLQPLSPSGSIPGIGDGTDVQPPSLDIDDFLNSTANYFTDFPADPNFDFNGADINDTNGAAAPTNTINGINFADLGDGDDELFGNVPTNNGTGADHDPAHNSNDNHNHNNYNYLTMDGTADNPAGRVESMASSEGASPTTTTTSITTTTLDGDGPTTRSRANTTAEQQSGSGGGSGNSPARKRKRMA